MGNVVVSVISFLNLFLLAWIFLHLKCFKIKREPSTDFYITGDKHRNFRSIKKFCRKKRTRKQDVLIILGDAGINFYEDDRDEKLKRYISKMNITLFCLHGNKEKRPQNINTYGVRNFCGGKVYYEPEYPNINFAVDGEIYLLGGKKYIVIGGAHSIDKLRCIEENSPYWDDEMPDDATKMRVENTLKNQDNSIYGVLTHTCPIRYMPTEVFLSNKKPAKTKGLFRFLKCKNKLKPFTPDIDRSTEEWLEQIEGKLDYKIWFCGHYHVDKEIDRICMLCNEIQLLNEKRSMSYD